MHWLSSNVKEIDILKFLNSMTNVKSSTSMVSTWISIRLENFSELSVKNKQINSSSTWQSRVDQYKTTKKNKALPQQLIALPKEQEELEYLLKIANILWIKAQKILNQILSYPASPALSYRNQQPLQLLASSTQKKQPANLLRRAFNLRILNIRCLQAPKLKNWTKSVIEG